MIITIHDKFVYNNYTLCHICNVELGKDKVRDHCHLSGKFRGAAHEVCNIKYKDSKFFPIVFTICLAMIATYVLKHCEIARDMFCISNNDEKYISFTKQVIVDKFVNNKGKEVNVKRE